MGAILCAGRGSFLIAGYNTMPADGKAKWNEKRLCQSTGKMLIGTSVWVGAICLFSYLGATMFALATIPVYFAAFIAWFIHIRKNPKFRNGQ
jgi:hypothetical protein